MRTPGPAGAAKVNTTVCASGAMAVIGCPPATMLDAATLLTFGSRAASSEKVTSAEVNGAPSDQVRFGRRWKVWVRPSGLESHFSASQGSTSKVERLIRTRRPCRSWLTTSVVWSRASRRLNERGSERMVPTICPPRCAAG